MPFNGTKDYATENTPDTGYLSANVQTANNLQPPNPQIHGQGTRGGNKLDKRRSKTVRKQSKSTLNLANVGKQWNVGRDGPETMKPQGVVTAEDKPLKPRSILLIPPSPSRELAIATVKQRRARSTKRCAPLLNRPNQPTRDKTMDQHDHDAFEALMEELEAMEACNDE